MLYYCMLMTQRFFRQIITPEDCELLQEYVYDISLWSDKWLLKFNPQKCKYMRIGNANINTLLWNINSGRTKYLWNNLKMKKDIGVVIVDKLSFDQHINIYTRK